MIDVKQFRDYIVVPTLQRLGMYSDAAVNLLLGTAVHESQGFRYIRQVGGGPALGLFQVEPMTLRSIYKDFLSYHPMISALIDQISGDPVPRGQRWEYLESKLVSDMAYGCAIARLVYWRVPHPLPAADDLMGLAAYWKRYYNTYLGAGTEFDFMNDYREYIGVSA